MHAFTGATGKLEKINLTKVICLAGATGGTRFTRVTHIKRKP